VNLARVRRLGVRAKLFSAFAVVFVGVAVLGIALLMLGSTMSADVVSLGNTYVPADHAIGEIHLSVAEIQRDQVSFLTAADADSRKTIAADLTDDQTEAADAFAALQGLALPPEVLQQGDVAKTTWLAYLDQTAGVVKADDATSRAAELVLLASGKPAATMESLDGQLDTLTSALAAASDPAVAQASSNASLLAPIVIGGIGLIILVGGSLAFVLSTGIVTRVKKIRDHMNKLAAGVAEVTGCLQALAANDLTVSYTGNVPLLPDLGTDEIGQVAATGTELHQGLKAMVGAYETARVNLTGTVGEVQNAASSVSRTSGDLNNAATQSGNGAAQIAQTITQVAAGASEQARAASETANATIELGSIIGQVGIGAAETSQKVEAASAALEGMAGAISSASLASSEVVGVANGAAAAAEHGRTAVRQTVAEMDRIKETVEAASLKVTELGAKSDQIGAIVETIDDIAEQTNLLALNAAIEAARAGEQGKGFAVVADEVRKLAERSSHATKEIAALIAEVQKGTDQAVKAMNAGAAEVEQGSMLANEAGRSLDEIADAVAATKAAVVRITTAVEHIGAASSGVVEASDAIASIAARTNGAAAAMNASADTVNKSVQAIAAISEENSASAEEVSAATEEMSAQAEEVVASAESLAVMASNLEALVARFKVGTGENDLASRIGTFRKAHLGWIVRLDLMLAGGEKIGETEAASCRDCGLGKWYYASLNTEVGRTPEFAAIEAPHARFHESCKAAVVANVKGDARTAATAVEAARRASKEVVAALDALGRADVGSGAGRPRAIAEDRPVRARAA
jgi:methyl-accepting chemotaxis protein